MPIDQPPHDSAAPDDDDSFLKNWRLAERRGRNDVNPTRFQRQSESSEEKPPLPSPEEPENREYGDWPSDRYRPQIDGYLILSVLGQGGMGIVYKAHSLKLDRYVAIKMIMRGDGQRISEEDMIRFHNEGLILARLRDPNIVTIYDKGQTNDKYKLSYFVMELIEGQSLATWLKHHFGERPAGRPATERIRGYLDHTNASVRLMQIAALAIHEVHKAGIVHRDLKPQNILLRNGQSSGTTREEYENKLISCDHEWGFPKVTDFGVARILQDRERMTRTGQMLGTLEYLSPEVAEGNVSKADERSDVYSLGIILFELLTGQVPIPVELVHHVCAKRMPWDFEPSDLSSAHGLVSKDLAAVCRKSIERDPGKRYSTAARMAADLGRYLAGRPTEARPLGPVEKCSKFIRRNRKASILVCSLAFIIVAGSCGWLLHAKSNRDIREHNDFIANLPALLNAAETMAPESQLADLTRILPQIDSESANPTEAMFAVSVRMRIGWTLQSLKRDQEALSWLLEAIQLVKTHKDWEHDPGRLSERIHYCAALTNVAMIHEKRADQVLPGYAALMPLLMPPKETVFVGCLELVDLVQNLDELQYRTPAIVDRSVLFNGSFLDKWSQSHREAQNLVLWRLRSCLLLGLHQKGAWEESLRIAEKLDACRSLLAGEPHYDVACIYANAYQKRPDQSELAEKAMKHLSMARDLGLGKNAIQKQGQPRKPVKDDADFKGLRHREDFQTVAAELDKLIPDPQQKAVVQKKNQE